MTEAAYDYICSIGEMIDKLSIENIKCHHVNMKVLGERRKNELNHVLISQLELKARLAGEQRVRLRDEINHRLAEAIKRAEIGIAPEARTYELKE